MVDERRWHEPSVSKGGPDFVSVMVRTVRLTAVAGVALMGLSIAMREVLPTSTDSTPSQAVLTATALLALALAFVGTVISSTLVGDRTPRSFRVAVLGRPRVGKTTLITAMFDEVFSGRVQLVGRRIPSESTAEMLNDHVEDLAAGREVRPTTDQETMAYRFEAGGRSVLKPRYRIELGDFPGEKTESLHEFDSAQGRPDIDRNFLDWASTADAIVVCIDSSILADSVHMIEIGASSQDVRRSLPGHVRAQIAQEEAVLRSAWLKVSQGLEDHSFVRSSRLPKVVVAFCKVDTLINYLPHQEAGVPHSDDSVQLELMDLEFAQELCEKAFGDLLGYLHGEVPRFESLATSSFAWTTSGRAGVAGALKSILPRSTIR